MGEEQNTNGSWGQQYGNDLNYQEQQYGYDQNYQSQQYGYDQNYQGQQYGYGQNYQSQQYGYDQNYQSQQYGYSQNQGDQVQETYGQAVVNAQTMVAEKTSSNVVTGMIGAFLGSLVGVALWVLIYNLGYIAGISGAIMVICAMWGYSKMGKCLDLKGIIISVVLCIGMIYISQRLSVSLELYKELKDYYDVSFFDCYRNMFSVLEELDSTSVFWGDLGAGYGLFVIASISYLVSSIRHRKK